ncbi:WYL domain-containing protein [Streptomyces sp. NPDC020681]|uniref:WYL domain-containing protein n=1 Tax=Streptomyces sp. NPDC020681 TaxID=3365083 RepID=UPI003789EDD6
MYSTSKVAQDVTLARLIKATDNEHPVTITYTKADGTETIRTIEIFQILTTKAGDIIIKAMDRDSWESRTWRLDRIRFYTVHRTAPRVEKTADVEPIAPVIIRTPEELTAREIARDDREYYSDLYDREPVEHDAA